MHQQRIVDVFLDYESAVSIFFRWPTYDRLDLPDRLHNSYTLSTIAILSWLDDPCVQWAAVLSLNLFNRLIIVRFDLTCVLIFLSTTFAIFLLLFFNRSFFLF